MAAAWPSSRLRRRKRRILTGFILAWVPVLVIAFLAVVARRSALELAVAGTVVTAVLAATYFHTPMVVLGLAALDGILTNLALLLVVFLGIALSTFLIETGSLNRMVHWVLGPMHFRWLRLMVISVGAGNMLEGGGVVAEPVVAPMIRTSGSRPEPSAILSIQGYAGVMALSMAGVVITILQNVTGLPVEDLARVCAWLSLPGLTILVLTMPLVIGETEGWRRALPVLSLSAGVVGVSLVLTTYYVGYSVAGLFAGAVLTGALLAWEGHAPRLSGQAMRDIAPFAVVAGGLSAVNLVPFLKELAFEKITGTVAVVPVHEVMFRPLFSAYLYLALGLLLAFVLFPLEKERLRFVLADAVRKGGRAVAAMGLFGIMGQMVALSGYDRGFNAFNPAHNMAQTLATGLVDLTGSAYPLFAPLLGWVGTFLTGYGAAAIVLFGKLQVSAAQSLDVSPTVLASAVAVGAGVGSISSPFKLALAAPLVGALGREGAMLRKTIPLGIAASLAVGVLTLLLKGWSF